MNFNFTMFGLKNLIFKNSSIFYFEQPIYPKFKIAPMYNARIVMREFFGFFVLSLMFCLSQKQTIRSFSQTRAKPVPTMANKYLTALKSSRLIEIFFPCSFQPTWPNGKSSTAIIFIL